MILRAGEIHKARFEHQNRSPRCPNREPGIGHQNTGIGHDNVRIGRREAAVELVARSRSPGIGHQGSKARRFSARGNRTKPTRIRRRRREGSRGKPNQIAHQSPGEENRPPGDERRGQAETEPNQFFRPGASSTWPDTACLIFAHAPRRIHGAREGGMHQRPPEKLGSRHSGRKN